MRPAPISSRAIRVAENHMEVTFTSHTKTVAAIPIVVGCHRLGRVALVHGIGFCRTVQRGASKGSVLTLIYRLPNPSNC
jgi:hypothetical protein